MSGAAPSWEAAVRIYIAALEAGPSDGADAARDELLRLAKLYEAASHDRDLLRCKMQMIWDHAIASKDAKLKRLVESL